MVERVQIANLISKDGTEQMVSVDFLSPVDVVERENKIYVFAGHRKGVFIYHEADLVSLD